MASHSASRQRREDYDDGQAGSRAPSGRVLRARRPSDRHRVRGLLVSTKTQLSIGLYVTTSGRGRGRIVDKRLRGSVPQWLVKLSTGDFLWYGSAHLTPVVN